MAITHNTNLEHFRYLMYYFVLMIGNIYGQLNNMKIQVD